MSDIESLEKYFDALLRSDNVHNSEHYYADDASRFALYDKIRSSFNKIGRNLETIKEVMSSLFPNQVATAKHLSSSFFKLSSLNNEDFDYYIRAVAVEAITSRPNQSGETSTLLSDLIESLMSLFFNDSDEIMSITKYTLEDLREVNANKNIDEEKLDNYIKVTLGIYEEVQKGCKDAKDGLIAKDKKMLEVLRQLRMGLGQNVVKSATKSNELDENKKEEKRIASMLAQKLRNNFSNPIKSR